VFTVEDTLGPVGVAFTDRAGGVSEEPFTSLNLAVLTPDDPAAVHENLRRVMAAFTGDPDAELARMRQVHGAQVALVRAGTPGAGTPTEADGLPEVDALVTDRAGLTLMVLVADCVPVLLADPAAGVVAAVHAGRVGVASGVVGAALAQMRAVGADQVTAWVGPHVCGACYEVPEELQEEVAALVPQARSTTSWGTPALDLGAGILAQLADAGVEDVRVLDHCTREDPDFPSYRRDGDASTRFAGVIWMRSER
jgi:YfiH family protein